MEIPEEFIWRYVGHRKEDYLRCIEYFSNKNFAGLESIGHQLKGNGMTFGFPDITELGIELEKHAKRLDLISLKKDLEKFLNWVERMT